MQRRYEYFICTAAIGPVLLAIGKIGPVIKILSSSFKSLGTSGIFAGTGINFAILGIGALIAILATALLQSEEFKEILMDLGQTLMMLISPFIALYRTSSSRWPPLEECSIMIWRSDYCGKKIHDRV